MPVVNSVNKRVLPPVNIDLTADYILGVQKESGEIPWHADGKTDPWDHVECAMGLTVAGRHAAAKRAYKWSSQTQSPDGSWWSEYQGGIPKADAHKDANMTAYIAVGVLHYYLATHDTTFLRSMWPIVRNAMTFVLHLQGPGGEIYWAKRADDSISPTALVTGSSSIYLSLRCAIYIATLLDLEVSAWESAATRLAEALRYKPHRFDQTKARFAMDWYYPILCGAISGVAGSNRLRGAWHKFVMDGWGIRCVSDQPWVTMAETSEMVITLAAIGEREAAATLFEWIRTNQHETGAYWTGITVPDRRIYTQEHTTWTGAAILLATDILYELTPAWRLFTTAQTVPTGPEKAWETIHQPDRHLGDVIKNLLTDRLTGFSEPNNPKEPYEPQIGD